MPYPVPPSLASQTVVECQPLMVSVEGLQTLKPQGQKGVHQSALPANGIKETAETFGGIDLELRMVIAEDSINDEQVKWEVENLKFSVKQPIEAVVTRDELQHLAFLCKSEVDSMGRIAAGILRLLKLEGSIGQAAIDQLSNLGSDGIDKIFSPKLSRGSSAGSFGFSPLPNLSTESPRSTLEATVGSLEDAVTDTQAKCAALISEIGCSESSIQHVQGIKQLGQKLESMQGLLAILRTQL
ncbi:hypothetical protein CJ030_MR0G008022 [Morella rubra]|uniref:Uncharacterized protein n=1 Tax=Morella rubra TaxID=262757 RepID=A0A6A1UI63_9ROSI|nr:hypothetical protein CJ030_MR0G008022 [Morella rubra]